MIQLMGLQVGVLLEPPWPTRLDLRRQQLVAQVLLPSRPLSTTTSGCQETRNSSD